MPSVSVQKQEQREIQARQIRDTIFKAAGIDLDRRMKVLRKAFERLDEQLDANKHHVTRDGQIIELIDNQARLRAIEQVVDLEGVSLGKQHEGGSSGPVNVNVVAAWFVPGPTTSSGEGMVIESGPAKLLEDKES